MFTNCGASQALTFLEQDSAFAAVAEVVLFRQEWVTSLLALGISAQGLSVGDAVWIYCRNTGADVGFGHVVLIDGPILLGQHQERNCQLEL